MTHGTPTAGLKIAPGTALRRDPQECRRDECLLAGSKHTGPGSEIPRRQSSVMASDAFSPMTHSGLLPGSVHGCIIAPEPPPGLRTDLAVPAGTGDRSGAGKLRRVPAGGTAVNAGVTWERVDAEDGGIRACPSVDRSATPRLFGTNE
ncbi:hypothetical protein Ahu01nite_022180 [Winogradskya humida]|uniref:Uncharacterized protein n=1 Tax=Winogradskya humida TaxID=113566 RepID=A0ABQ3ZKJ5_9ACTN|nr:hypothetical protein Ahu01nite_022180 [Actinoplanes humidus]